MQTELQGIKPRTGRILNILAGILIVMFPVGLIIMFTAPGRSFLWTTSVFLGLEALITVIILAKLADVFSVVIASAVIFMASWFLEYWGVNTGIPFGQYSYTHVLSPLVGGVPLAICFAWFVVTANSLLAARYLLNNSSEILAAACASVFILASDILLEPFASFVNNFWIWNSSVIPVRNFISWFAAGLIFLVALSLLIKWRNPEVNDKPLYKISLLITAVNIINFSVVNIVNGYYFLTITGLAVFAAIILSIRFLKSSAAA